MRFPLVFLHTLCLNGLVNAFVPWKPGMEINETTTFKPIAEIEIEKDGIPNTPKPVWRRSSDAFVPYKPDLKNVKEWKPVGASQSEPKIRRNTNGQTKVITMPLKHLDRRSKIPDPIERQRLAVKQIEKYFRIRGQSPTPTQKSDLSRRQNATPSSLETVPKFSASYPPAVDPVTINSIGVSQDGFDLTYFVEIEIGSRQEKFSCVIDTGSSDTWVPSSSCVTRACGVHERFDFSESSTFKNTLETFGVTYGTGTVAGVVVEDFIKIGDFSFKTEFGMVTNLSNEFSNFPIDGILGLGLSNASRMGVPTVMDRLKEERLIERRVFAVTLSRGKDQLNDGQLSFGGIDDFEFNEPITYSPNVSPIGLWEVNIEKVAIDGFNIPIRVETTALLDTGTSYMLLPADVALMIHRRIPGAQAAESTYLIPCDSSIALEFTIAGQTYAIPASDFMGEQYKWGMCISRIAASDIAGPDTWLLGAAFLKSFYQVYDMEANQVGLARRKTKEQVLELRGKGGSTPDKNKKNDSLQVRSQFKWLSLVSATAAWLF